jgi:hypothetical protein
MTFTMSNGAPATFAVDRTSAEVILGTDEIQEIYICELSARDWAAVDSVFVALNSFEGLRCYAVAC